MRSSLDVSLEDLRRRRSYKWRAYPADVLPAFVAEMDFGIAPAIATVLDEAVAIGDTGYAWLDPQLGVALSAFARARFGWDLDPADVVIVPDVMAGILEVLRIVCEPGDGVVVNTPVYPPFFSHIAEAGCRVVESPLALRDRRYELDLDALEDAFRAGARVYLLCNPHNPTGRVFERDELAQVAQLAERHDVLILADEIHAPLVLPGASHVPLLTLGETVVSRCIAFMSASKGWNIPGLKCAQAIACSPATRAILGRLNEETVFRAGNLGIIATVAAYRDGVAWLDELLGLLDSNREMMWSLLAEHLPSAGYSAPEGGYLAWIDCSRLGIDGEPAQVFLDRGRVALRPGPDFGTGGAGHVRVTMATSPPLLAEIVRRMAAALAT